MMSRRYADLPIWAKLLVPFVLLMFVWGFFGTLVLVRARDREARGRATAQLAQALDIARASFADEESALVETVRLARRIDGLAGAATRGDTASLARLLLPLVTNGHRIAIRVTDGNGRLLVTVDGSRDEPAVTFGGVVREGAVLAAASGATDALGDKFVDLSPSAFVVAGPIAGAPGPRPGAVAVSVASGRLAERLAHGTKARVTVFATNGLPVAASGRALPYRAPGSGLQATVDGGDEPFEAFYAPLQARESAIGTLAVGLPTSSALAGVKGTATLLAILVGFAVACAVAIGIVTARAVTVPVANLVRATRALERGDLATRAPRSGDDEIGRLADAFNRMAGELETAHRELERKVAERTAELRRVNDELARASDAKSAFLATMSHELRTPLNAVIGFADILADPELSRVPRADARGMAANILSGGRHLLTVINDVLDLATIEAGRIHVEPRPCDVGALLTDVRRLVEPLAAQRRIALAIPDAVPAPLVQADPARTRQILFNLLANAIKFTPRGGHVRVDVTAGPDRMTLGVSDDGPGLTEEEAAVIFDPFERADGARKTEGAGLGLALVRSLVHAQGGRVAVESAPGRGSRFTFTIPRASAEVPVKEGAA